MQARDLTTNYMVFDMGASYDVAEVSKSAQHPNGKQPYIIRLTAAYPVGPDLTWHVMEDAEIEARWCSYKTPKRPVDSPYLADWLRIGKANPWIRTAYDPPFSASSIAMYDDPHLMANDIDTDNWSIGSGFAYQDVCLIQQVEGPGEMLVILRDKAIDSWTTGAPYIHGEKLVRMVQELLKRD